MTKTTVIDFARPSDFSPDPLTDVLRAGARELLATAVRAEVSAFMKGHAHLLDDEGRQRLVRHGFLPERDVMTGIGKVTVQVPRVRDRGVNADGSKVRFNSSLVPPYLRKAKSVEELAAVALSQRYLDGRFQRGAGITCRTRRRWIVRLNNHAPKGDLVGRI